jgi:AcrR family transcriptional regulator
MLPTTQPEAALGRRERGKLEKLRRIKAAAREVFREKGYEAATTREIAARADVAYGTLFAYASDKRDLMMMIINEDLEAMTDSAYEKALSRESVIDQVIEFFRPRFSYWAREPEFSRYAMRESFELLSRDKASGPQTAVFRARRPHLVARLADIVARQQAAGRIRRNESSENIALLFMAIYRSEVRFWLEGDSLQTRLVLQRMRRLLRLTLEGLAPKRT